MNAADGEPSRKNQAKIIKRTLATPASTIEMHNLLRDGP
jgi:hypothetical protein